MMEWIDKFTEVEFTYHFVDYFHTVLQFRFNESVCTKKRQIFYIVEKAVNFKKQIKATAKMLKKTDVKQ